MEDLKCNKCNTINKVGSIRCSNCGFTFGKNSMETVGKYLGEFAPKPTLMDVYVSSSFIIPADSMLENKAFSKPTLSETNIDSIYINDSLHNMESVNYTQDSLFHSDDINGDESNIIPIRELNIDDSINLQNQETEPMPEDEAKSDEKDIKEPGEAGCIKCGYILSDFSTVCPNCGHSNVKHSVTQRMPNPDSNTNDDKAFDKTIAEENISQTGSYPPVKKSNDASKTISENASLAQNYNKNAKQDTQGYDNKSGSNVTMREGSDDFRRTDENIEMNKYKSSKAKSKVRLEAIYLGQDSDQNMIINIPDREVLDINRSLVDEADSTISSDVHATVYKEGNEWKIANKSSNKALFVQVNDPVTLKNGDVIMLGGDKFYVFVDEDQN